MKKLTFAGILIFIITMKGYSQIEKHTILVGGYASFDVNSYNNYFIFNPNSGIFVSDKWCLGVSVPIVYTFDKLYWGLTPFGRYYFKAKESRSFFITGAIGLTSFINSENTLDQNSLSLGIGHVWLLNKSVGFETHLQGSTSFDNIAVGLFFGFQIYFNKANE